MRRYFSFLLSVLLLALGIGQVKAQTCSSSGGEYLVNSVCTPCPAGTYKTGGTADAVACTLCAAGTYGALTGQTSSGAACTGSCIAGKSSPAGSDDINDCVDCLSGTYSTGGTACLPLTHQCAAGKYSKEAATADTEAGACTSCPTGIYTTGSATGQTSVSACTICAPGYAGTITGSGSTSAAGCNICAAGSYAAAGQTSCTPCSVGFYQASQGQSSCSLTTYTCGAGKKAITGASSSTNGCTDCLAGTYQSATGHILTTCSDCPAGSYGATAGLQVSTCTGTCTSGTYSLAGASSCPTLTVNLCPAGKFAIAGATDNTEAAACTNCPIGTSKSAAGNTASCTDCAAGSYQASTGQASCTLCAAGKFGTQTGQSVESTACTSCAAGSYQANTGQTSCTQCAAGKFGTQTGQTSEAASCTSCAAGSYQANTGQTSCILCAAGKFGTQTGQSVESTACTSCAAGSYQANTGQTSCTQCSAGKFGTQTGQTSEVASCTGTCTSGSYSLAGASSCSTLTANLCPAGKYSIAGATDNTEAAACTTCPPGTFSLGGASNCTQCPKGTFGAGGSNSTNCSGTVTCNAGYYALAGAVTDSISDPNTCAPCPPGQYSTPGSIECINCPGGYYGTGGGTSSSCSGICQLGTFSLPGSTACSDCPAGYFGSTTGLSTASCSGQVTCNGGKYALARATSNDVSSPTTCTDCPAGTFGTGITSACSGTCLIGTYSLAGSAVCLECPAGTFSTGGGSTTSLCSGLCPQGTYSFAGSLNCTNCEAGFYGSTTGLTTPSCTGPLNCSVGKFALAGAKNNNILDANTCANCPPGKYSMIGSISCSDCPSGTYGTQGSTSPACSGKCPPGTWGAGASTSPSCSGTITCNAGYYALEGAKTSQISDLSTCAICLQGKFSLPGSVVCLDCEAGSFAETSSVQTSKICSGLCLPGSYALAGSTTCSPCPSGTFGNSSGLKSSICSGRCDTGSFSEIGAVNCSLCSSTQYSFGGAGCSSCDSSIGSVLISSSRGCMPSSTLVSGPSDTSFYLSGSQSEGVLSMTVSNSTSGVTYVKNHLSSATNAINLASRSYLTATPEVGSSMLAALPRFRESFSASVWVKCAQPASNYDVMTVLSWGAPMMKYDSTMLGRPRPSAKAHQLNLGKMSIEPLSVSVLAGSGSGFSDGLGTSATFNDPQGICIDTYGTVYVADSGNHRIRIISTTGVVSTLAGNGISGSNDDLGTNALFNSPKYIAVGPSGSSVFVTDSNTHRIRMISTTTGLVMTLAGSTQGYVDGVGTNALFSNPKGIAVGPSGKIYVADSDNNRIRIVSLDGSVITLAGGFVQGSNDGVGTSASFDQPHGVCVDSTETVYVSDGGAFLIRKITPDGVVETLSNLVRGGIAADLSGNIYFTDLINHGIRVAVPNGATFLGGSAAGSASFSDGVGTNAAFSSPRGVAVSSSGALYIADSGNHRIRVMTQTLTLPVCDSTWRHLSLTYSYNGSSAETLYYVDGAYYTRDTQVVTIPSDGTASLNIGWSGLSNFYTGSLSEVRIYSRVLTSTEIVALSQPPLTAHDNGLFEPFAPTLNVQTYTWRCRLGYFGDSATRAQDDLDNSWSWSQNIPPVSCSMCSSTQYSFGGAGCSSCDSSIGSVLISSSRGCMPSPTLVSGPSDTSFYLSGSQSEGVLSMTVSNSTSGVTYVKNHLSSATNAINLASRSYLTATPEVGSSMLAALPRFRESFSASVWVKCAQPASNYDVMTVLSWGGKPTVLNSVFDAALHQLSIGRSFSERLRVSVLAGSGSGSSDGLGTIATFNDPQGICIDTYGTVYVADTSNHRIRMISTTGVVSTLAGGGSGSNDGLGTNAMFNSPRDVVIGPSGNIYVADSSNHRIRIVSTLGVVSTLAGSTQGYVDGTGTNAMFNDPQGVSVDSSGNVYVADTNNHRIRIISSTTGVVSTIAGSSQNFADGIGTSALFNNPRGIAVGPSGKIYVADTDNKRIRVIVNVVGIFYVTTLAGSTGGYIDGFGTNSAFTFPRELAVDSNDNIYVADVGNHLIRIISSTGYVTTLSGRGSASFSDGVGTNAAFSSPRGVAVSSSGALYIADSGNHRIRVMTQTLTLPVCDSTWRHLSLTYSYNGSSAETLYYVDGAYYTRDTQVVTIPSDGTASLNIGWSGLSNFYTGSLSEVRIYSRVLTSTEIVALSQPPLTAFPNTLVIPYVPTLQSSAYSWACLAGHFGTATTHLQSSIDMSWFWSAGSAPQCLPCEQGSFSSDNGTVACTLCPQGKFGRSGSGFTSLNAACESCEAGRYSSQLGAKRCSVCPAGTWSWADAAECTPCPEGYYSNVRGSNDSSLCVQCPRGTWGGGGIISSCIPCAAGLYGIEVNQPPISQSISCRACLPGTFSSSGSLFCTYCPVGFFSETDSAVSCDACPSGYFGVIPGASNQSLACQPCPSGTYNELSGQSRIACMPCGVGTASNVKGSNTSADCISCKAGTYSSASASFCSICRPGSFSSSPNSETCTLCPRNTYLPTPGGSSLAQCIPCPTGTSTSVSGTSEVTDCLAVDFVCPSSFQVKKGGGFIPLSISDCVPLVCPFPLLLPSYNDSLVSECQGCRPGTFGSQSTSCKDCSLGDVCPGVLGIPLINGSILVQLSKKTMQNEVWLCPGGALGSTESSNEQSPLIQSTSASSLDSSSVIVLSVGSGIVLFTFALFGVLIFCRRHLTTSTSGKFRIVLDSKRNISPGGARLFSVEDEKYISDTIKSGLESIDAFSLSHALKPGQVVEKSPTALGGAFTVAAVCSLAVLAATITFRRQSDNVLVQQSVAVLDAPTLDVLRGQPWSRHQSLAALPLSTPNTIDSEPALIRVRVVAAGDVGSLCGVPLSWSQTGLESGSFIFHSGPSLQPCTLGLDNSTAGRAAIYQLQWTCVDCLLSPQSELLFSLPYSCQSLALEVSAAAADGNVGIVVDESDDDIETRDMLAKIEWSVLPLLDVRYDLRSNATDSARRGYTLINGGITTTRTSKVSSSNNSFTHIAPASAAVEARIGLSLQPYYSRTTLTEKTTLLQLFASIVGLAGIFSVFGILFQQTERFSGPVSKHLGLGRHNHSHHLHHSRPSENQVRSPSVSVSTFDALNEESSNFRQRMNNKLALKTMTEKNEVIDSKNNPVFFDDQRTPVDITSANNENKSQQDDEDVIHQEAPPAPRYKTLSAAMSWRGSKPVLVRK